MTCHPLRIPGGGYAIVCTRGRGRRKKMCATCREQPAELECDGCDQPLCDSCTVSPQENVDFCPACARPVWLKWLHSGASISSERDQRRADFRAWARENPKAFDIVKRGGAH